jgi:hypothetical protein
MISFNSHNWWIAPLVLALIVYRLRSGARDKALKIERLWVIPVLLLIVGGLMIWQTPIAGPAWLWLIPIFIAGAALGYWRGRFTLVTVNPETHDLTSRTSAAGLYLIIAVLAVRIGLRAFLTAEASAWHLNVALITDAFLVFAIGLIAAQRLEIWIRARGLLADARAARA